MSQEQQEQQQQQQQIENQQILQKKPEEVKKAEQDFTPVKEKLFQEFLENPVKNYFYGSVYAAFLGDSIGSYLEFRGDNVSKNDIERAMKMPGGGQLLVAPGQVTDDSEMALSLTRGLIAGDGVYDEEKVTQEYSDWVNSPPFDMGNTTMNSFIPCYSFTENLAQKCRQSSKDLNQSSQSNGSIMRITPLAVWGYQIPDDIMIKVIKDEITITHPNQVVIVSSTVYVMAIKHLIELGAKNLPFADKVKETLDYSKKLSKKLCDEATDESVKQIMQWWEDIEYQWEKKLQYVPVNPAQKEGWIKIAWMMAFFYLGKTEYEYQDIYRYSFHGGGDTDTNACICLGMIGAAKGLQELIEKMEYHVKKMIFCDFTKGEYTERDQKWNPKNLLTYLPKLYELAQVAPKKMQNYQSAEERESKQQQQEQQQQQIQHQKSEGLNNQKNIHREFNIEQK